MNLTGFPTWILTVKANYSKQYLVTNRYTLSVFMESTDDGWQFKMSLPGISTNKVVNICGNSLSNYTKLK